MLLSQVHAKDLPQGMGPKMANAKTAAAFKIDRKPLLSNLGTEQASFALNNHEVLSSFSNKKISFLESSTRLRSGEPKASGHHGSANMDCETDSQYNKQLVTQAQTHDRGALAKKETASTGANFKTRCSSTRQDTKMMNSHSKRKLLRNMNSMAGASKRASSNVPASHQSKMSTSKMSANDSEWQNKQIQHAAAAVLARSKQQSAKNLK